MSVLLNVSAAVSLAYLEDSHELLCRVLLVSVQRSEFDLLGVFAHVPVGSGGVRCDGGLPERPLDSVQIVRSDRDESTLTAQVLMELVLKVDERLVLEPAHRSGQSQDTRRKVRSQRGGLGSAALAAVGELSVPRPRRTPLASSRGQSG